MPHAVSAQNGAPEPPEKRANCGEPALLPHTHEILVRVHDDAEAMLFDLPQDSDCVVEELLVVFATVRQTTTRVLRTGRRAR